MRHPRKRLMVSLACAGLVMVLLLTAVLTSHLLANREMVKAFIVDKTAQATGGALVYDRLEVSFFPVPHLKARHIRLQKKDAFDVNAKELSVYPRILPILNGRLSIRRLAVIDPGIMVRMGVDPMQTPHSTKEKKYVSFEDGIRTVVGSLFGALAAIDPETDLQIENGAVTLAFIDTPDLRISGIYAAVVNDDGDLSMNLRCRSDLAGNLTASANADIEAMQASGQISLTDINVRPLLSYASLPGGITTEDTQAAVNATFTVAGPEAVRGRFDLRFPALTVMRSDLKLDLDRVSISGAVDYADKRLSVSIDTLQSLQPALGLSAAASIKPAEDAGRFVIDVNAAAKGLDVAVAGAVTRAIAGDLKEIKTAFSVAKEGRLTNASYHARFYTDETGWHLKKMKAAGHLSQGLVTIPGIEADLESMDGEVTYEDRHVAFNNVSGHFKGAAFEKLNAAIDWETTSTLKISSPSVAVDTAPLFAWLTRFKGLDKAKKYIESATGTARLDQLEISGPLTEPSEWAFDISGTPESIRLTSPLVPFAVVLSGGNVHYIPGQEQLTDVRVTFLDGNVVTSYRSEGIFNHETLTFGIDGSIGQETIDWLSTLFPIPNHLQMKPPVELADVNIVWSNTRTLSIMGQLKTAGGVDLFADFSVSPKDWNLRRLQFSDGSSRATASAHKGADGIRVSFSGNVEKNTADLILESNQTLSGRLEGYFRALIDTRSPLKSSFTGKLAGEGLHILKLLSTPIDVDQFSIEGSDGLLTIQPSVVSVGNNRLIVDGKVDNSGADLTFDLNVDADRLDEELIRALQPIDMAKTDEMEKPDAASPAAPRGVVHVGAADFSYGGFTWSQVRADVQIDGGVADVQVHQANLCGISTAGRLRISPQGVSLHAIPMAAGASLQETANCFMQRPIKAQAQYDLAGEVNFPPIRENPARSMSGQLEFSSEHGRIDYSSVLMKIFSVLNITEMFTGGQSDLMGNGYGYTKAYAKAEIRGGKLQFSEILLDGNSLKITGQGSIALDTREVDITLLAAPLKTLDRVVNKMPIVNYIAGGSLISIPLRLAGPLADIKVTPMSPSAVGKGLLNIMGRTLKAPFRLVQSAAEFAVEESSKADPRAAESPADGP